MRLRLDNHILRLLAPAALLFVMPAFCADYFGPKNMGPIYGLMLTAWSFASAFGPLLIAHLREVSHAYRGGLHIIAGVLAVSIVLPLLVRPPRSADAYAKIS